jgi:uncharacterized radical SAM superfamily Fe-S cluster-containing enzyme
MTKTKSICPVCQKKIDAKLAKKDGKVVMVKHCAEHGDFTITHWQSPTVYNFTEEYDYFKHFEDPNSPKNPKGCPEGCSTCNSHVSDTVIGVIDVTKKCDLRCPVCFSTFNDHIVEYEPTKDDLIKMLNFLSERTPKPPAILFSGGEPLQRDDIAEIVAVAHNLKFMTIMATNGLRLSQDPDLALKLKQSGLNIVYLQFDTFHDDVYMKIRGKKMLQSKYKAIEVCRKLDMEVILVTTLIRGFNDSEVGDIIRFAAKNSDIVRGIIFQPIAFTGRAIEAPKDTWRDWQFAEEVQSQTNNEISAKDMFPLGIMVSPIKLMRKFMKKPWPLFSCSPHCGIVNWVYVSKSGKMIPINRFVNFDRFFRGILKTAKNVEKQSKFSLLTTLFMSSTISLDMLLVTKEVGIFTLMKAILKMFVSPSYQSLGPIRRRIFMLGCMAFMDQYNFDVNRVRRCVVHYVTPNLQVIPFCAYNNVHRIDTEEQYATKGQQPPLHSTVSVTQH